MAPRQRRRSTKEDKPAVETVEAVETPTEEAPAKEEPVDPILAQRAKVLKSYKKQILGRE